MRREIVTSVIAIVFFTLLLGIAYPLVITGVGQIAFPGNANGQKVYVNGRLVGSKSIGQSFRRPVHTSAGRGKRQEKEGGVLTEADPRYFQSRPSATEGGEYDAARSAFSNRGPNSVKTKEADERNLKAYLRLERPYDPGLTAGKVPVDAVNTSASNLDPDISQANARIQAHRVASVRHLALATVEGLISSYTSERGLLVFGEPAVNVLELNLALDRQKAA